MEEGKNITPPRWAEKFLSWFCKPEILEYIQGDLEELFFENMELIGAKKSKRKYIFSVLGLFRPGIVRNQLLDMNILSLFANYFKVGFRQIKKHKLFAGLNILGLATSMSVCLLIIMILSDQYAYDEFHENKDRIYRVISNNVQGNWQPTSADFASAPISVAEALEENYSFLESVIKMTTIRTEIIWENESITDEGGWVNQEFLDAFDFGWIAGDQKTALIKPNSIVITEPVAREYFKEKNPIGQVLQVKKFGDFIITGVMPEPPRRSHLKFELLVSHSTLDVLKKEEAMPDYHGTPYYIYTLLKNTASEKDLISALSQIAKEQSEKEKESNYYFEPQLLSDISPGIDLHNGNSTPNIIINFLIILGLLIILSACFNYTNLSLARSLKRTKEIGVRKVIGAKRGHIILQFVVEAVLISFFALALALFMLEFLMDAFYNLDPFVGQQFLIEKTPVIYLYFLLFSVFVGLVAGLFTALHLSSFRPIQVLNNLSNIKIFSRLTVRRMLLVAQFSLSLIFILATLLVIDQQKHFLNADLGIQHENVLNASFEHVDYDILKKRMEGIDQVVEISGSYHMPLSNGGNVRMALFNNGKDSIGLQYDYVTPNYIKNMGIRLLAGKTFPDDVSKNNEQYIILNEMATLRMGFENPEAAIGHVIKEKNSLIEVIGVVKDYHYANILFEDIRPFSLRYSPEYIRNINIKVTGLETPATRKKISQEWKELNTDDPLYTRFVDQRVFNMSRFFTMGSKMVGLVGFLAIIIACMGLLGMVIYAVEEKAKEIGIRKVLGASERGLIWQLSKGFFLLLGISILIAVPIIFFAGNMWLNFFVIHTSVGPKLILTGVGIILLLALATVVSQTWNAARSNPVGVMRVE